jgi:hypothetical protein
MSKINFYSEKVKQDIIFRNSVEPKYKHIIERYIGQYDMRYNLLDIVRKSKDVIQDINLLLQERRKFFEEIIEICK